MEITYQRSSIEAIGGGLDPQRLLEYAIEVLPRAWVPKPDLLQSPAVSRIVYPEHVDLLLQENYFRVLDLAEGAGKPPEGLADLARGFLKGFEKLDPEPHYSTVNVNFEAFAPSDEAEDWVVERFVADSLSPRPGLARVELIYDLGDARASLSIDIFDHAEPASEPEPRRIRIGGAYLTDHPDGSPLIPEEWSQALGSADRWRADFEQRVATLMRQ